jgi:hypothetical protein
MHEPLVTRQEIPRHASYSGEVQKKYRVLMAGFHLLNTNQSIKNDKRQGKLKCIQLNLQHSRLGRDNLKQYRKKISTFYASKSITKSGIKLLVC